MQSARLPLSLLLCALLLVVGLSGCARPEPESVQSPSVPVTYPVSESIDHIDTYHGIEVADPYRWLEDLDGDKTAQWVAEQNAVAQPFLEAIPSRATIRRGGATSIAATTACRIRMSCT